MTRRRTGPPAIRRGWRTLVAALAATTAAVLAGAAPAAAAPALDGLAGPAAAADLDVMTFNLRYASTQRPNSWTQRRPVMTALLAAERPHLIGTQEGLAGQLQEIRAGLGARYGMVAAGREGGNRGEHMAIFYHLDRLAPQEHRHFWLSDTPEVPGSNTWGGGSIRMVTWVRFLDLVTRRQFYAVNTHLDNWSEDARRRSAQLIRQRLAAFTPGLPVVLTGDFNGGAWAGNPVYDILQAPGPGGLVDTWPAAAAAGPVYGTFHNYAGLVPGGPRIDWILATPGVTVPATMINTYRSAAGQLPSDHLPVQARLRLPTTPG